MGKISIIFNLFKFLFCFALVGLGVWYMSQALGGTSISYININTFADAIGAGGDAATPAGCFMCSYISDLFDILSKTAEGFWTKIIGKLWLVMALGFGLYVAISAIKLMFEAMQKSAKFDSGERKIEIKSWLDGLWKNGARILVVGVLLGIIGGGGTQSLKIITNITATPILYVGVAFGEMATRNNAIAPCSGDNANQIFSTENEILSPVFKPFLCVVSNVNTVVLAGAAGGLALMNYSFLGLDFGGGVLTWVAGLALVLMFLYLGFNIFFQILSIMFKLIFVILFLPLLLAAAAFEKIWAKASGLLNKSIDMLVSAAIKTLAVTLKVVILFGVVSYSADMFFPGPVDGFTSILPKLVRTENAEMDEQALYIMNVFKKCEDKANNSDNFEQTYVECFNEERSQLPERYKDAFDFMDDGWSFLSIMLFIFVLYIIAISPKVDQLLPDAKTEPNEKDGLDFGAMLKGYSKSALKNVNKLYGNIKSKALERAK